MNEERRRQLLAEMHRNQGAQEALTKLAMVNLAIVVGLVLRGVAWQLWFAFITTAQTGIGTAVLWWLRRRIWDRIEALNDEEQAARDRAAGYVMRPEPPI